MRLYITAFSFEDRCLALPTDLPAAADSDRLAIIDFAGYENVSSYVANRLEVLRKVREKRYETEIIQIETLHPLLALRRIESSIERAKAGGVLIDISTLPKNILFVVMKLLAESGIPTRIRYYRTGRYGKDLSHGIRLIQAIPGFEGDIRSTGETILAVILGFEGYKALHAWERIGPSKVVALIGDPPYSPEFLERSRENNREFTLMSH